VLDGRELCLVGLHRSFGAKESGVEEKKGRCWMGGNCAWLGCIAPLVRKNLGSGRRREGAGWVGTVLGWVPSERNGMKECQSGAAD